MPEISLPPRPGNLRQPRNELGKHWRRDAIDHQVAPVAIRADRREMPGAQRFQAAGAGRRAVRVPATYQPHSYRLLRPHPASSPPPTSAHRCHRPAGFPSRPSPSRSVKKASQSSWALVRQGGAPRQLPTQSRARSAARRGRRQEWTWILAPISVGVGRCGLRLGAPKAPRRRPAPQRARICSAAHLHQGFTAETQAAIAQPDEIERIGRVT